MRLSRLPTSSSMSLPFDFDSRLICSARYASSGGASVPKQHQHQQQTQRVSTKKAATPAASTSSNTAAADSAAATAAAAKSPSSWKQRRDETSSFLSKMQMRVGANPYLNSEVWAAGRIKHWHMWSMVISFAMFGYQFGQMIDISPEVLNPRDTSNNRKIGKETLRRD